MPGRFGQSVLKHFGLGDKHHGSGPSDNHLPGKRVIGDGELILSERGTYPRLAKLSDGSILAAFTRFEGKERVLCVSKSTDGGRTYSDWGQVSRGVGDVDNMFLLEVSPQKILAAFRNHDLGPGGPTFFRITVCQSVDGGRSWSFLSQAAQKKAPLGIWEPFMRKGCRGEVQLTYSQEFAHNDQRTMLVVSHDEGQTWSQAQCVAGDEEALRDGMNGITETKDDGRDALVMVFETTRYGTFNVEAVVSYDDGATWKHRHQVYDPPRGHNAGAPQISSFADGSLAAVFMCDEDSDKVEWTKYAAIKVVFACPPHNGKIHWSKPTTVCRESSSWPGIMALDHHTVLVTYDYGGPKARTIAWHHH
ncbi:hypothetical protein FQN54_002174 [Arachnomyces sp. PD_36]|nr:hypothetical protein FQN54_002174 [Arachnomyces sp. PD_36]